MIPSRLVRFAVLLALALPHAALRAQDDTDRHAVPAFRLAASARAAALGGAATAEPGDEGVLANPGALVDVRGASVEVVTAGDARQGFVHRMAMPAAGGTIAVGVRWREWRVDCRACAAAVPATPAELVADGAYPASAAVATIGYARPVKGLQVGVTVGYADHRMPDERAGAPTVDVGILSGSTVRWGVAVRHLGPALRLAGEDFDQPLEVAVGVAMLPWTPSVRLAHLDLAGAADLAVRRDGRVVVGGGVEATWVPVQGIGVAGRLGARSTEAGERPLTAGLGLTLDSFSLDYAVQPYEGSTALHRLGVRWRLR